MKTVRSRDGTVIAYERTGEGPPVILVGGALSDRTAGAPLAALLAPPFTVVTYDRRGRGDSGDTAPYAVEREIEDLHALIDDVGGAAFVYGMSSGAALALRAAASRLPITKLALFEPPYIVDGSRPPIPADYLTRLNALLAAGRRGDAVALFMTEAVGVPTELVTQLRSDPMWPRLEATAHTLPYDHAVLGDMAIPTELAASVTIPTLVVDGGASPAWLRQATEAVAAILPGARRQTLEGQTHAVAPDALAPVLLAFFAG
ncbi:MAG: alpha/beta hydrolase [Sphaerobacter sp.]|nr:alpha/beta hydrolase [Sphaerobacter sp.]